ncbi:diiron oxygenase [Kineosporia sp. J2-2]|uniref:Diiron oxygenase n=1 Tax=Kineosporia corallincola TaxID=2835133 RepID=A0ABS5TBX1_9ACTN|nr:diiron oxygenase [Kineosporia corallincola]MBT0768574.1 diiron oxygenase [Kineosporia corallincola]
MAEGLPAFRPLDGWYDRAGVRHDPHRRVTEPDPGPGQDFFPRHLMPHTTHPLVQALAPQRVRELEARHLYQYLSFTAHFETRVVNRAALHIAEDGSGVRVGTAARADALKIYTDEGYHALYSLDLVAQLEAATRIPALRHDFRPFLARLDLVGEQALPGRAVLAQLLQVVVFETLVTSILSAVPADPQVLGVVRETVADHARDEGRHHAYFSAFFRELWAGLGPAERAAAARCLPALVRRSLEPELTAHRAALLAAGLTAARVRTVLAESYPAEGTDARIAADARHTVRLFRDCGVLEQPGALDAFASAGLVGDLTDDLADDLEGVR